MANSQKSTLTDGVSAFLFLSVLACATYVAYLHLSEKELLFHEYLLTSSYFWKPVFVVEAVAEGGWLASIISVLTVSIHMFTYGIGVAILSGTAMYRHIKKKQKQAVTYAPKEGSLPGTYLGGKIPEAKIILSIYKDDKGSEEGVTSEFLNDIFPETYIRLDRLTLNYPAPPKNEIESLERALWSILCAHKEWPADPYGHHADQPLYLHSKHVAEKLVIDAAEVTGGRHLARVIGLGHDIGKIMAYEKTLKPNTKRLTAQGEPVMEVRWNIMTKQHDSLSAHIVRMLPEFKLLSPSDQNTVDIVLSYSHKPEKTPKRRTTHVELSMLRHLRKVDGLATEEDQSKIGDLVHNPVAMQEIKDSLSKLILQLNINARRGDYADGWTSGIHDYIAVMERALREGLDGHLSPKLTTALGLKTIKTPHPATPVIREALEQMGLLITQISGSTPYNAMFSMTVGRKDFHGVFLLRRDLLEKEAMDIVEAWGECKYTLKVITYKEEKTDES